MDSFHEQKESADKYSLRGRVFHKIRDNILSGKYSQNEELKEVTIGNELGVSRTPVREALRQLELEGLVNIIPNKGAYVNAITAKDIHDIYMIRSYLEGLCARMACENITEKQMEDMDEVVYLSEFHTRRSHEEQIFELDNKFHELLYEASGSRILSHLLSDYHQYVQRIRKVSLSSMPRAMHSNEEHIAIMEAIREHNADKAESLAHEHIKNTIQNISEKGLEKLV
ncbi:GntR family transcriptional regulator [Anaerosporobacter sp.]|uniref:GntR family transcriptional regulator n=1 Tax=Anaerosporobacter sp. TaxID=1872529 RepID=UPI00286F8890|nr:GntR family transcriptional regulator [Anaerosporobacter sp.]